MNEDFFRFPHTPHLIWLGNIRPRDDKVLSQSEAQNFLSGEIVIEEKVDGANVGISIDAAGTIRAQNRGQYIVPGGNHPQWSRLWAWISQRSVALRENLAGELILFGEWCYARHSIEYNKLPDWLLGFDVYDKIAGRFWSVDRRNALFARCDVTTVPQVSRGHFKLEDLPKLIGKSAVGSVPMEGVYLRRDIEGWLDRRTKIVRNEFVQQIEDHWTKRPMVPNKLILPNER